MAAPGGGGATAVHGRPPTGVRDQPTFTIEPKRPSASSLIPAAKNNVLTSPPLPPLPKRRPHRPSFWIGALVSLFSWPRNAPPEVKPLIRPSPKLPTRMSLWKLPKVDGARARPHGELRLPRDAKRRTSAPAVV